MIGYEKIRIPVITVLYSLCKLSLSYTVLQSSELDEDADGLNDLLNISITVPLLPSETVQRVTLLLFFNLKLMVPGIIHPPGLTVHLALFAEPCESEHGGSWCRRERLSAAGERV